MINSIAKKIQTRLSRQGLKVALGEIKDYLSANLNADNLTEQDAIACQEYFINSATKLTVIEDNMETVDIVNPVDTVNSVDTVDTVKNAPLATATKSEMVSSTATQMGIVLDAKEISLIAENISESSDDFDRDIDAIKSAIMAFINHKSLLNQGKIASLINEVRHYVSENNSQNSQLLSEGLRDINSDINNANKAFKSQVATALSAFNIPALKAG
jgi:hypothetical protein